MKAREPDLVRSAQEAVLVEAARKARVWKRTEFGPTMRRRLTKAVHEQLRRETGKGQC